MILCYGCFQISMGTMPSEKIWYVFYANYIALGLRGIISGISILL